MNEVVQFLTENPVQYLATVGTDGKAKCRPFMFCLEHNSKLWFSTSSQKDVYRDILKNPYVEFSVTNPTYAWLRLNGKVVFENNMEVKEICLKNPMIKGHFGEANNPNFEVFYLAEAEAVISDFSGNPPAKFLF